MKNYFLLCALVIPFLSPAQEKAKLIIDPIEGPAPWTSLDLNNDPVNFQFAIVTDRTGGHRPGVFMQGVNKLNLLQPEFVMSVGDLIEGYTENIDELNRQWNEFDGFVKQLEMPFFYVPGNHDITNQAMEDLWKKRLGPTYYHFVYHNVLFICLNSEDQRRGAGKGTISNAQFDYFKKVLEDNPGVKWTLVFLHQPLWHQEDTKRWSEVEELLANRKHTVFAGHEHRYVKAERNNGKYFVLATTGGGSNLRGPALGEFDHVAWVTMTDQGPLIANIELGGIWDENVVLKSTQDYIKAVSKKTPVSIAPIYLDRPQFSQGEVAIKIQNDEDVPMKVKFDEKFSWNLIGILPQDEWTVSPNSVETFTLQLSSRNDSFKKPLKLTAALSYRNKEQPDLTIPLSWNIKPLLKHSLQPAKGKIKIDGKNNEWDAFGHIWNPEASEIEAAFDLRFDREFLYIAAQVRDPKVVAHGKGSPWTQDHIGIGLNAQPLEKSAMSTGKNWYENEVMVLITPETKTAESVNFRSLPEGSQTKCVQTEDGYFTEVAIPITYVTSRQGENWKTVRFNIVIGNSNGSGVTRYHWMPDWRGKENIIGSGMFFKQADKL